MTREEQIVAETFQGLNDLIEDLELAEFYKDVILTILVEYRENYNKLKEAYGLLKDYTVLLGDEIDDMVSIAYMNHWSSKKVDEGVLLRKKIMDAELAVKIREEELFKIN